MTTSWRRSCSWVCCHHTELWHIHGLEMSGTGHNPQTAPAAESSLCRKQDHSSLGWWTTRLQITRQNRWWKWTGKGGGWFWKRSWECQISCYETWKLLCSGATYNFISVPQENSCGELSRSHPHILCILENRMGCSKYPHRKGWFWFEKKKSLPDFHLSKTLILTWTEIPSFILSQRLEVCCFLGKKKNTQ